MVDCQVFTYYGNVLPVPLHSEMYSWLVVQCFSFLLNIDFQRHDIQHAAGVLIIFI